MPVWSDMSRKKIAPPGSARRGIDRGRAEGEAMVGWVFSGCLRGILENRSRRWFAGPGDRIFRLVRIGDPGVGRRGQPAHDDRRDQPPSLAAELAEILPFPLRGLHFVSLPA